MILLICILISMAALMTIVNHIRRLEIAKASLARYRRRVIKLYGPTYVDTPMWKLFVDTYWELYNNEQALLNKPAYMNEPFEY